MANTYPNHGLRRKVHGHIQMKRALEQMAPLLDAIPSFTADDIGKSLTVVGGAAAEAADGTLTFSSTGPAEGDTIVIGGRTYSFVSDLSTSPTIPNQIVRSDTPATVAGRLAAAINDGAGTNVSVGTLPHDAVSASAASAVVTITADVEGSDGNSIIMDVSSADNIAASGSTLSGGQDESELGLAWA